MLESKPFRSEKEKQRVEKLLNTLKEQLVEYDNQQQEEEKEAADAAAAEKD